MKNYTPRPNWNGWTKWMRLHTEETISCCDCGLAHLFKFKTEKGKLYFRAKKNKEITKENREKIKKFIVIV